MLCHITVLSVVSGFRNIEISSLLLLLEVVMSKKYILLSVSIKLNFYKYKIQYACYYVLITYVFP
jgi:hypothetical protein